MPSSAHDQAFPALDTARRMPELTGGPDDALLDARALSKLKWRCRRGLLENDLFIARFFEQYEATLTLGQARALEALMDLADHDLLDLLLKRKEPDAALASAGVTDLLRCMRI